MHSENTIQIIQDVIRSPKFNPSKFSGTVE